MSYSLNKKTCGGAVGISSLLIDRVAGKTVNDLIGLNETEFYRGQSPIDSVEKFLNLKHILAVKTALRAYTGDMPDDGTEACTIINISNDGDQIIIDAEIDIPLLTERIESCVAECSRCLPYKAEP